MGLLGTIELAMLSEFNLALSEFESMCSWHGFVSEGLLWTNSKRRPPPLRTMCFSSAFLATSSSLAPFTPNQGYSLANRLCQPSFGDLPLPLPLLTIPDYWHSVFPFLPL